MSEQSFLSPNFCNHAVKQRLCNVLRRCCPSYRFHCGEFYREWHAISVPCDSDFTFYSGNFLITMPPFRDASDYPIPYGKIGVYFVA